MAAAPRIRREIAVAVELIRLARPRKDVRERRANGEREGRHINGLYGAPISLRSAPVFDPVSVLLAAKSGLDPSAYTVLRPDPGYLKRERFGNRLGRIGAIVVAIACVVGCFLLITNSAAAFFFPNPLARAGVYLYEFSFALAGLAAAFVILPRSLERKSRQALILTPDGLILTDWEQSEVIRAIDYRATDKLTLKVDTVDQAPDLYRLIMTEHGKTKRWTIEEYFEAYPAEIASRVVRDYARAKERG